MNRLIGTVLLIIMSSTESVSQTDSIFVYKIYYPTRMPFDFGEQGLVHELPDSLPSGIWVQYHESDSATVAQRGQYINGRKQGEFTLYDKDGLLIAISYYQYGVRDSICYYSSTNQIIRKRIYNKGILVTEVSWFNNGNIEYQVSNEHQIFYYSTGSMKMEKRLRDGEINGLVKIWDETNMLIVECMWEDGAPIMCKYKNKEVKYRRLPKKYQAMSQYKRIL